ncbi:MAG: PIN domain-containing protein [Candidatus Marinimicrobia bacterium]|nr:PIN domain-containing protein [bacterium]MCG2716263.1 PIN domain-containing protein [Candidatus Neomarinimicrobiota bacterium]
MMDSVLTFNSVYVPKVVTAELYQGAKSQKEIRVINEFFDAFFIIDQKEDTWIKAGMLSFDLKRKGVCVNLTDCYIAVIAAENECKIFTLDKHFKLIQEQKDLIDINFFRSSILE